MLVTLPSVGITLVLHPTISVWVAVSIMQFPLLWYIIFSGLTVIFLSPLQRENASLTMLVTLSGIVMLVSPVHPLNAEEPMVMTLSEIVTLVRPVQKENAELSMLVTLSGIVTLVSPVQW